MHLAQRTILLCMLMPLRVRDRLVIFGCEVTAVIAVLFRASPRCLYDTCLEFVSALDFNSSSSQDLHKMLVKLCRLERQVVS